MSFRTFYRKLHASINVLKYFNVYEEALLSGKGRKEVYLEIGAPGTSILRRVAHVMKESTLSHFDKSNPRNEEILQYGCMAGCEDLRNELSKFLTEKYKQPVDSKDLFINSGASQGITNLLSYFFDSGDTVFVEDKSYWSFLANAGTTFRMNAVSVDMDQDGMRVDKLERYLENFKGRQVSSRHPYRGAVYTIPVHHNPTGVCLSEERSRKLVELARKHDLLVICDDVYNAMTYTSPKGTDPAVIAPPTRLFSHDSKSDEDYKGNVISVSSFSKLLAPGLRVGWFEMPERVLQLTKSMFVTDSGSGWNGYTGGMLAAGFQTGIVQECIEKTCSIYAERIERIHEIVTSELEPYGVHCNYPDGGIFMWITLPNHLSAECLLDICKEEISFIPGNRCSLTGSSQNCLRIAVGFYEDDVLYPAIHKLCQYIREYIQESSVERSAP